MCLYFSSPNHNQTTEEDEREELESIIVDIANGMKVKKVKKSNSSSSRTCSRRKFKNNKNNNNYNHNNAGGSDKKVKYRRLVEEEEDEEYENEEENNTDNEIKDVLECIERSTLIFSPETQHTRRRKIGVSEKSVMERTMVQEILKRYMINENIREHFLLY